MNAALRDKLNFLSKLRIRRVWNMMLVYGSWHLSKVTGRTWHPALPLSVSLEPTTACNLGCPECPSGLKMFSRKTGNIQAKDSEAWLHEIAPHVSYINFYFQGEPFIHPNFLDMVRLASSLKIYTATSTNAHFLHDEMARRTVESGLDRLIISLDGTTQEVYEKYRVNGQLDKVIEGTKNILAWKKKLRSSTPFVIFQFLVVRPNEHQIAEVYSLATELGVDEVRLKTAQVYNPGPDHPLIPENLKYSRYVKSADGSFVIRNTMDNHCWRMWSSCVITWDGKIVPCCFDKDAQHALGDLRENSLRSIWNNQAYRSFRSSIFKGRSEIDICANCSEGSRVWVEA